MIAKSAVWSATPKRGLDMTITEAKNTTVDAVTDSGR